MGHENSAQGTRNRSDLYKSFRKLYYKYGEPPSNRFAENTVQSSLVQFQKIYKFCFQVCTLQELVASYLEIIIHQLQIIEPPPPPRVI